LYIPVNNPQGGGADISSLSGKKPDNKKHGLPLMEGKNIENTELPLPGTDI